jgi:arabinofuranan 3-O-arabinosyltransferase
MVMIDAPPPGSSAGSGQPGWWRVQPAGSRPQTASPINDRLRHQLWLAACCLLLAAMAFVTRPGNIIADTKIDMALDPVSFLQRALQLWDPAQFGELQNQAVGYFFPMGPFYVVGLKLALPAWVVQRLWLTAVFVAAFLGTVRLADRLGIGTQASRIAAGFGYALAPRGLSLMGVNSSEFLPVAMLPLILIPLVRLLRHGQEMDRRQKLRAAAQSGAAVALCGGINAAAVFAVALLALLYVLTGKRSWSRWRVLAWWAPAVALATWWWTIPLLLLDKYSVSILPYTESAAITTSVTSLSNILRGTEDWTTYLTVNFMPWWPVGYHISTSAMPTVLTGLVAALGLGGLLGQRMAERRFLLWALLAGLVIIGSGYVSGLGNPLASVLDHVINGPLAPLRNIRKFDPLIRLPVALGLAQLLGSFRFPRVRTAAACVAACGLAGLAIPAAVTGLSADGDFPAVPSYWISATNWLNAHADNQAVLAVPGASFGEYIWGRPMDDVLEALFRGNWASTQVGIVGSPGNTRILSAVEQRIEAGDGSAGLTQLLADLGVKYIVVRNDLMRSDLYGAWPSRVLDGLYSSPGLVKVAQFGTVKVGSTIPDDAIDSLDTPVPPVEIFQVTGAQPVATVQPAAAALRVFGGPEAELNLADAGVLKNHPVLLNADDPGLPASQYAITDTLRRIVRNFGEVRIDYSQTLTARAPADTFAAADDYLESSWLPYLTVAQYHGIANVTASSSGAGVSALPGQSATGLNPFSAIDGNMNTMWESASLTGPVHQWLQVNFVHPVNPGVIEVAFADNASIGPPVTQVDVSTSAGRRSDVVRQTGARQPVRVPAGPTRWLRITVTAVAPTGNPLEGTQAGIAEISVPGVTASRSIDAPDVALPGTADPAVLLAKAEPQPSGCMRTTLRWVCSPSLIKPTEEQYGFDEEFTVARGHPATVTGLAVMTNTQLIEKAVYRGSQPTLTASSSYTADPEDMASSAFDGNLSTSWISGAADMHPVLKIRWPAVETIRSLTIVRPPGASSLMQVLVTGSGGQSAGGVLGTSDKLTFRQPLRTDQLTLSFTPSQLPVQIEELQIPGLRPLTANPAARVTFGCGQGPTLFVDGTLLPTEATGTVSDLLDERPLTFTACSGVTVRSGHNDIVEPTTDLRGFDVQSVLVDPAGNGNLRADATVPSRTASVIHWSDSSRQLRVDASQRSFLIVRENFNAGWQARIGRQILRPVQLDGWEQAWLLPAGTRGLVQLTYVPDRIYRAAVFGGLTTVALVIIAAFVPLHRRRRRRLPPENAADGRSEPAAAAGPATPVSPAEVARPADVPAAGSPTGRRLTGRVLLAALVLAGVGLLAGTGLWFGGYPGLLLLPATTFLFLLVLKYRDRGRWWRWLGGRWLVPLLLLAAAVSGAAGIVLQDRGDSGTLVTALVNVGPQVIGLVIVARIIAELVRSGLIGRRRPSRATGGAGPG